MVPARWVGSLEALQAGRGLGVNELLRPLGEWPLVVAFALVTQLGDVWFLCAVASALYVGGRALPSVHVDRRRGAFVLGTLLVYIALIGLLKGVLAQPRPVGAAEPPSVRWLPPALELLFADVATATGYGFPSGHALGTTLVWGGMALVVDGWNARRRYAVAAGVVVLVSLSRLVLGVHFLVDVLAGAAVGVVALGGLYVLSDRGREPGRVMAVAVVAGLLGVVLEPTFDGAAALGAAVGGAVAWWGVADLTPRTPGTGREFVAGTAVVVLAAAVFLGVFVLSPSLPTVAVAAAVVVAAVVAAPAFGRQVAGAGGRGRDVARHHRDS